MPYTVPTRDQFRKRFPIFENVDDTLIDQLLIEASGVVDKSWRESDYQPAILYAAAHLVATDNSAEGESVAIGAAGGGAVASESFGQMSISYATGRNAAPGSLSANDRWGTTEYGRRYLALLKLNKPAVVVV